MRFPGPGTYTNKDKRWNKDIQTTIKSRNTFFYDNDLKKLKHCISPQKYLPKTKLQENKRFSGITFGKGFKFNDIKSNNFSFFLSLFYFLYLNFLVPSFLPGPGSYNIPSVFDKSRKCGVPLN